MTLEILAKDFPRFASILATANELGANGVAIEDSVLAEDLFKQSLTALTLKQFGASDAAALKLASQLNGSSAQENIEYKVGDREFARSEEELPKLPAHLIWNYDYTEEGGGNYYVVSIKPGFDIPVPTRPAQQFSVGDREFARNEKELPELPANLMWKYDYTEEGGGNYYVVALR